MPDYDFHYRFRRNFGISLFVRSNLCCQREEALEPHDFDLMWFKLITGRSTIFICCLYRPPSDSRYSTLLASLETTIDYLQINHPAAEIAILGDFNVHNTGWLISNTTDEQGRQTEAFAISCGLTQLVQEPTRVPDRVGDFANLLDLFLTSNPEAYTITVNPPLGSSDHKLISASCTLDSCVKEVHKPRTIWHYRSANWDDLKEHFLSFPWLEVCFRSNDPSVCAREVTEVILAGMEAYIPYSKKIISNSKPCSIIDVKGMWLRNAMLTISIV